jgi:hypothetical protein
MAPRSLDPVDFAYPPFKLLTITQLSQTSVSVFVVIVGTGGGA